MDKANLIAYLSALTLTQVAIAAPGEPIKLMTTAKEIGAIPLEDSLRGREASDFQKNWKGKTLSFTGKVNWGGGVSIEEYNIEGCSRVLKKLKPGAVTTVTGVLASRFRGGSGGEPVELSNCRLSPAASTTTLAVDHVKKGASFLESAVGRTYASGSVTLTVSKKLSKVNSGKISVCFGEIEPHFFKVRGNEASSMSEDICQATLRFVDEKTIEMTALSPFCKDDAGVGKGRTKTFILQQVKHQDCQQYND